MIKSEFCILIILGQEKVLPCDHSGINGEILKASHGCTIGKKGL